MTRVGRVLAMAALGIGVVTAVHLGRSWAEGGNRDLSSSLGRDALLVVGLAVSLPVVLLVLRFRRPVFTLALAVALQSAVMFTVEHLDGFRMPLGLDVLLGCGTWAAAGVLTQVVAVARAR